MVNSTIYPGSVRPGCRVLYPSDGQPEDLEEEELRPLIITTGFPERRSIINALLPAIDYLEARITGTCEPQYDCSEMYKMCELLEVFDPSRCDAALDDDPAEVIDKLTQIPILCASVDLDRLKVEVGRYLALASKVNPGSMPGHDVDAFTTGVTRWWAVNGQSIPEWAKAARIVFSMSPNSASCERVFSLLKVMFGETRDSSLGDMLQASLMLRYNDRNVG